MAIFQQGVIDKGQLWLRRAVAILSAALVAIVAFAFLSTQLGADAGGHIFWGFLIGIATLGIWWNAQSDNRRAKAANDKTLIVTSFTRDCVTTAAVVISAGALLSFAGVVPLGVTLAAAAASLLSYNVGKHIWTNGK